MKKLMSIMLALALTIGVAGVSMAQDGKDKDAKATTKKSKKNKDAKGDAKSADAKANKKGSKKKSDKDAPPAK